MEYHHNLSPLVQMYPNFTRLIPAQVALLCRRIVRETRRPHVIATTAAADVEAAMLAELPARHRGPKGEGVGG